MLREKLNAFLKKPFLVVFGSVGRGTPRFDSDIDILLIGRNPPPRRLLRIREFEIVEQGLAANLVELVQDGIHGFLSPLIKSEEEVLRESPLFLDMLEDSVILSDRYDFFRSFLEISLPGSAVWVLAESNQETPGPGFSRSITGPARCLSFEKRHTRRELPFKDPETPSHSRCSHGGRVLFRCCLRSPGNRGAGFKRDPSSYRHRTPSSTAWAGSCLNTTTDFLRKWEIPCRRWLKFPSGCAENGNSRFTVTSTSSPSLGYSFEDGECTRRDARFVVTMAEKVIGKSPSGKTFVDRKPPDC